jgi:lysine 6-dehydrogenase
MDTVVVLGTGLVGNWIVRSLSSDGYKVIAIDADKNVLSTLNDVANTIHAIVDEDLINSLDADVFVNALPGRVGHRIRKILVENGHKVADLAFTPEDPSEVNQLAIDNDSILIYDVGVAPGLSNLLLKEANRRHGRLTLGRIRVGGNPTTKDNGWSYMAPFSPVDVIEEYTRPARIIRNGQIVTLPALSERIRFDVSERGEMEAFLTDGLRSVLRTIDADELVESTVRWPGHIDMYIDKREELSEEELVKAWSWDTSRSEFTWMEVYAEGKGNTTWILDDSGDEKGSSMARTTGAITCAVVKFLLKNQGINGVHPPENFGHELLEICLHEYSKNKIKIHEIGNQLF